MASRALKMEPQQPVMGDPDIERRDSEVDEAAIAARAYECWQERGCPVGSDQEDWFRGRRS